MRFRFTQPRRQDTTGPTDVALEIVGAQRHFGGVRAVDGASFTVRAGDVVGLIGPNGAGKSTMVDLICGNTRPQSGAIRLFGRTVTGAQPYELFAQGLTRTFQHSSEFPRMSVLENLMMGLPPGPGESFLGALGPRRRWIEGERRGLRLAPGLMEQFELAGYANTAAGELSGGQRRLVEIMRALMAQPKVLVLDEPLAGVHVSNIGRIINHIARLKEAGVTCLIVEHDLAALGRIADECVVMSQGKVIAQGPMSELRKDEGVLRAYAMG
jgi:ABC-type branched-subunit amino acid transport system ATPase component